MSGWEATEGCRQGAGVLGGNWEEGQQQAGGWDTCEALLVVEEGSCGHPAEGRVAILRYELSFTGHPAQFGSGPTETQRGLGGGHMAPPNPRAQESQPLPSLSQPMLPRQSFRMSSSWNPIPQLEPRAARAETKRLDSEIRTDSRKSSEGRQKNQLATETK